jgi:hypothetical protein
MAFAKVISRVRGRVSPVRPIHMPVSAESGGRRRPIKVEGTLLGKYIRQGRRDIGRWGWKVKHLCMIFPSTNLERARREDL